VRTVGWADEREGVA